MKNNEVYQSPGSVRSADRGEVFLDLVQNGMSPIATLFLFGRKGKSVRVEHYSEIRKQLKKKLGSGFFESLDFDRVDSVEDVFDYVGMTSDSFGARDIERAFGASGKGYDLIARLGFPGLKKEYHLVRTNEKGHKVIQTKKLSC